VVTEEQLQEQEKGEPPEERAGTAAAPGQVTSLRRLGGRGGAAAPVPERKKRGWGASRGSRLR